MISIQTYTPKTLSSVIRSFWCLKVSESLNEPYTEEILPDGHHEIIFHLNSAPIRKRAGSDDWLTDPAAFFVGQNKKSYRHRLNPGAMIYGVRFHPHTQALFYNFPASLSTDNLISLPDISTNDILMDCISESPEKTFANFEREFIKKASRLSNQSDTFLYVDVAVRSIINQKGNVKIGALEKLTGVSGRHLEKSFHKFVGVSPKQFCNTVKFSNFVTYRKNHPDKSLTECAYEAEFHDQSHLIYLSHQITGQSPKSFFNKLNYINDFFLEH
jgi:AraC-like DNA-binding protein